MHKGKVVAEKENFKIINCEICGFKHLGPIPSKEEIKKYYERQYYQGENSKTFRPSIRSKGITMVELKI